MPGWLVRLRGVTPVETKFGIKAVDIRIVERKIVERRISGIFGKT